jgi:membrane protease YdiL (CAAX protease family)
MCQTTAAVGQSAETARTERPARGPSRKRNLVALALGLLPPYLFVLFARLSQGRGFTLHEMVFYPLVVGTASLVSMLVLLRYVCGEPVSALNRRGGSLLRDTAAGAALAIALVVFTFVSQPVLSRLVAPHRNPDAMTLVVGLIENPLLLVIWFGPVLWIGVAAFEEVARVFCMTRIMSVWPGAAGQWGAVAVSTAAFGLMHYYQGPTGVIGTGVIGLMCALLYVRRGRIWPLIVGHALYDAWSIGMAVVMVSRGMR